MNEKRLLSELITEVDTPLGRERVRAYLASLPFPHYEAVEGSPDKLCKIDEDGTRTIGRFVNRVFVRSDVAIE